MEVDATVGIAFAIRRCADPEAVAARGRRRDVSGKTRRPRDGFHFYHAERTGAEARAPGETELRFAIAAADPPLPADRALPGQERNWSASRCSPAGAIRDAAK